MPYDSNGNATITRNRAVTGQTVQAAQVNTPFDDVQSMLSQVLLRSGVAPMAGSLNMNGFRVNGAADGVTSSDLATVGQLQLATPIGSVVSYAGANAPSGWMLCFGQAVSRIEYASLFAAIGTSWGAGDGSTTFNIPDLRGRVEAGKDDMGGSAANRITTAGSGINGALIGSAGGSQNHTLTVPQMPSHGHGVIDPGHSHNTPFGQLISSSGIAGGPTFSFSPSATTSSSTGISIVATGGDMPHNNMQPTAMLNKIIKVS